jgi:hypothetical protein
VVAGNEDDRRLGQRLAQALKLLKGEENRGIGGPHRMEEVADHHDRVRTRRDDPVHRQPEGVGDIRLSLIDARGGLTMELPNTQVGIGEVGQSHTGNVM